MNLHLERATVWLWASKVLGRGAAALNRGAKECAERASRALIRAVAYEDREDRKRSRLN